MEYPYLLRNRSARGDAHRLMHICSFVLYIVCAACAGDDALAPPKDVAPLFWELSVNYPAVRLSLRHPYDTLQLKAVPYNASGGVWAADETFRGEIGPVIWSSTDESKVHVSETGHLTARGEADKVLVYASQQIDGVTRKDTVWVQIKDEINPPVLKKFSIHLKDSLKRAMYEKFTFPIVALDQNGDTIRNIPVKFFVSDLDAVFIPSISFGKGTFQFNVRNRALDVRFSGKTWVYGVAMEDSLTMQVGWPVHLIVSGNGGTVGQAVDRNGDVQFVVSGGRSNIGPGGSVQWTNNSGVRPKNIAKEAGLKGFTMDVIFDDSTIALPATGPMNTGGGNVRGILSDTLRGVTRYRRFVTPGEYPYTIQPLGFRGVVVVHDR